MRAIVHLILHLAVPAAVARRYWGGQWLRALAVMMATMAVDLDHLLADPIYDPNRCSIGFHPLHRWPMWGVYLGLALWPRTRLVGVGLVIHMVLDAVDCAWMRLAG